MFAFIIQIQVSMCEYAAVLNDVVGGKMADYTDRMDDDGGVTHRKMSFHPISCAYAGAWSLLCSLEYETTLLPDTYFRTITAHICNITLYTTSL